MNNTIIPIARQCELLGLSRSSFYYRPHPASDFNLYFMTLIDRLYTKDPSSSGVPRITKHLRRQGYRVNRKRVARLMRNMGLQGIAPKKRLSQPNKEHHVYPYLLKNLDIIRPNQVFCADITYIPMQKGFIYLTAVMDWYSIQSVPPYSPTKIVRTIKSITAREIFSRIGTRPSKKSIKRMTEVVHVQTERNMEWMDTDEMVEQLNRKLRGWANYFQLGPVTRAYRFIDRYTTTRLRRWFCRKHKQHSGGIKRYSDEAFYNTMGLIQLPKIPHNLPWAKA